MRTKNLLTVLFGCVLGALAALGMTGIEATEYRLDTGDNRNLVSIVNQHAAILDALRDNMLNSASEDADLAEGTNANTIKTTDACSYTIAGVTYEKAATDNIVMTAASAQADLTYRLYLVSIIADGTVTITAGTAVATDTAVLPALPADSAPLGYFKIATSGGTFTSGTTDLSAAGVTDTFVDLTVMNSGPSAVETDDAHTARAR